MTTYATLQDMLLRFDAAEMVCWTDTDGSAGAVVPAVFERAEADAAAIIDSHLQTGGYVLPLLHVPALLVGICCDLARARLAEHNTTEVITNREKLAYDLLKRIAEGKLKLGLPQEQAEAGHGSDEAVITSAGSVWARDKSKGFI
ncbi:hypothetical protein D9M70_474200 [compost metagenome]